MKGYNSMNNNLIDTGFDKIFKYQNKNYKSVRIFYNNEYIQNVDIEENDNNNSISEKCKSNISRGFSR